VGEQDRAGARVGEQRLQRVGVALHRRVADDVDRVGARPGGGQRSVERRAQLVAQHAQRQPGECRGIGRHHAGPAAVGHDGQATVEHAVGRAGAGVRGQLEPGQGLGGDEKLLQRVHAQHAGAADRGNGGLYVPPVRRDTASSPKLAVVRGVRPADVKVRLDHEKVLRCL